MKRKHRLWLPAITLLLSATLLGLPTVASEGVEEEREAATTITPVIEAPSGLKASPLAVITPVTEPDTPVVEGEETKPVTTTARTAAVIEATGSNDEPSNSGWFGSWFQSIIDAITGGLSGLANSLSGLWEDMSGGFDLLGSAIGGLWDNLGESLSDTVNMFSGRDGTIEILKNGGKKYASDLVNHTISVIYDAIEPYGIAIMLLCFCFAIARGCFSKELLSSNSLLQPVLGMLIALAAFALSEEIMTALFTISMNLTNTIADKAFSSDIEQQFSKFMSSTTVFNGLGYAIVNGILELVLMMNVARLALLQAISPLFIGLASGQGTRRFMLNFVKEYIKCCLIPPMTIAFSILSFAMTDATIGLFSSIILGVSIWSIGGKMLDRLFA